MAINTASVSLHLAFLRPLALPRAATIHRFFSASASSHADAPASTTTTATTATATAPSPRSAAAAATSTITIPAATRPAFVIPSSTTRAAAAASSPTPSPPPPTAAAAATAATTGTAPPPARAAASYVVERTSSLQLPVYHVAKRGGNMKQTKVRKILGDIGALRAEIRDALALADGEVTVNPLTRHVIIKGFRKNEITKFLEEKSF